MSKITPKNLSYDSTLPPFLARMQANNASRDDRHEYTVARPKKARNLEEEAEDEPVYFNEESNETLTKGEWEAREAEVEKFGGDKAMEVGEEKKEEKEEKEKVALIGGGKKRKVGKIVGADAYDEEGKDGEVKKASKSEENKKGEKTKAKPPKKAKKVKLSFDDDE